MMTIVDLKNKLEARKMLMEAASSLKEQVDLIDSQLKEEMLKLGSEELKVDNFTVRYKEVVSQRLDTNRLKSAMNEDLWKGFCNTQTTMRFTVTEK